MDTADGVVRAAMSGLFDDDEIDEFDDHVRQSRSTGYDQEEPKVV